MFEFTTSMLYTPSRNKPIPVFSISTFENVTPEMPLLSATK